MLTNMIQITDKIQCCGCNACGDICPKGSITFKMDVEGFWYPEINKQTCINCGLCEKVCPILNNATIREGNNLNPPTYLLQYKGIAERFNSTSGCIYPQVAKYILEKGGYIAGHIYDKSWGVKTHISNNLKDLEKLRNSKYCQSDAQGFYKSINNLLKEGKLVLASGCPCQIAALKNYLRKDFANLITIDFTCMGIDNPLAFKKYIEYLEEIYESKVTYFKSKSKEIGWRRLTNKAIFENGRTYYGINGIDPNLIATFMDILVRPSCFDCKFKGKQRIADISIGDFWTTGTWNNYETLDFSIDDNSGTSYIMLNNKKAEKLFEEIKHLFKEKQIDADSVIRGNKYAIMSLPMPEFNRSLFFKCMHENRFDKVVNEFSPKRKKTLRSYLSIIKQIAKYYNFKIVPILRCIFFNISNKGIDSNFWEGDILMLSKKTKVFIEKGSKLVIRGKCLVQGEDSSLYIKLTQKSELHLCNNIFRGNNINIDARNNAKITLGNLTSIYGGVNITSMNLISIGDFCQLSRNVLITDNNEMVLTTDDQHGISKSIEIGTHCLFKDGTIIRKGCIIGDEVITKEYSIIEGNIPSRTCLGYKISSGNNILWKNNF